MSSVLKTSLPLVSHCWTTVGVRGDRSCPELLEVVHCQNCPVHGRAAQSLLERPIERAYFEERGASLAEAEAVSTCDQLSVVVFEVNQELFALPTNDVLEVSEPRTVHRVPNRSNRVFTGLANMQGQLELCFALDGVLGHPGSCLTESMLVASLGGERWVLCTGKVRGVQRFTAAESSELPATSGKLGRSTLAKVLVRDDQRVGLIDPERLRSALEGSLR